MIGPSLDDSAVPSLDDSARMVKSETAGLNRADRRREERAIRIADKKEARRKAPRRGATVSLLLHQRPPEHPMCRCAAAYDPDLTPPPSWWRRFLTRWRLWQLRRGRR